MTDTPISTVIRSFKFRLRPSRNQHAALAGILSGQRELYNAALQERIECYRHTGRSIGYMNQCASLTVCRRECKMDNVPVALQRFTLKRIDEAFLSFFRRVKSGVNPGFPRFKGADFFKSFGFTEPKGIRISQNRVWFQGLPGALKMHAHRPLPLGKPLSCTFRRDSKGWTISLQYRVACNPLLPTGQSCGVDVGLIDFATFDDGRTIPAPKVGRKAKAELRRRRRQMARCKKGSARRVKMKAAVAACHAKIANARNTFLHQVSASIVRDYDTIAIEHLNVKGLAAGMLAYSVHDASWSHFFQFLSYKAESAGRTVIAVDPRHTSQTCSSCGVIHKKALSQRWHDCPDCGLSIGRDHNAAINILHRAVVGPGGHKPAAAPVGLGNITVNSL